MIGGRSAILIEVPAAEPLVGRWRAEHDPVAPGVPPHITLLFPFRPPERLDAATLDAVAAIAHTTRPFDFSLATVDQFDGVIWLRPQPETPFAALTRSLYAAFPDCPPYEGRHDHPQPHLTIAHAEASDQAALRADIERDIGGRLPVQATATEISVLCSDRDETAWTTVARFALDARPPV